MFDLPALFLSIVSAIVAGFYCYRWGHSDGFAEGAIEGPKVAPQGGGGPGVPEK